MFNLQNSSAYVTGCSVFQRLVLGLLHAAPGTSFLLRPRRGRLPRHLPAGAGEGFMLRRGHRRLRSLFPRLLPPCRTAQAPHPAARCPSRHGFLSAAVRRRPYGSGRRTRSLRAAGAGHSGVHTPQLPARGLPPLPAALLRVPSSVQLPPAGAVCRDDTLAGRPRGEGRRAGRARKPTFRTAKP